MKEFIYNISILSMLRINILNKLIENRNKLLSSNFLVLVATFFNWIAINCQSFSFILK